MDVRNGARLRVWATPCHALRPPAPLGRQAGGAWLRDELASFPHTAGLGGGGGHHSAEEGGVLYHRMVERSRTVFLPLSSSGQLQLLLEPPEAQRGPLCTAP